MVNVFEILHGDDGTVYKEDLEAFLGKSILYRKLFVRVPFIKRFRVKILIYNFVVYRTQETNTFT